jgi:nitroreductase
MISMEVMQEILQGPNVRKFLPEPVSEEVLERILEAGRMAPSAKNRQPWRFLVITKDSLKEELKEYCYGDERLIDAGAVILCCTTNIDYKMPNDQLSYPMDITMAASYLMFQARHEGLGAAIMTTYREQEIRTMFSVPYSMRVVAVVLVGKSEDTRKPYNRHEGKRIISYNHW